MNTYEKLVAMAEQVATIEPAELPDGLRDIVVNFQALRGVADIAGFRLPATIAELIDFVLPLDDPAELDVEIDRIIGVLIDLRGDDLPPFDPNRYGEATVADA